MSCSSDAYVLFGRCYPFFDSNLSISKLRKDLSSFSHPSADVLKDG